MIDRIKTWSRKPVFLAGVGLAVLLVLAAIVAVVIITQQPPPQPIAFPHSTHVGLGAQCLFCHPGAASGPVAGLPTSNKCWGCHQQINKESAELDKLANYVRENRSIPWVPVAIQPDFVHFNHQPHIAVGLNCETCHGEIGTMTTAEPQRNQNMGWCITCHRQMADSPQKVARLLDCVTCHY